MTIEELVKEQKNIDKVLKTIKRLNKIHNNHINNKADKTILQREFEQKKKKMPYLFVINFIVFLILAIIVLVLEWYGFISTFISAILGVLCFGEIVLYTKKSIDYIKLLTELEFYEEQFERISAERTYNQLCEERSLYHQLVREHENKINMLSSEEYQEYQRLVDEYQKMVDESVSEQNTQMELPQNKSSESPVLTVNNKKGNKSNVKN